MNLWALGATVLVLLTAIGLVLVNPTTEDYLQFVDAELGRALDRMDRAAPTREQEFIRQVFRKQSKKIVDGVVLPHTVRRNWGVLSILSIFETDALDTRIVVLGICGTFIPIRGMEEASGRLGRLAFE
jgi:hypothetical protein